MSERVSESCRYCGAEIYWEDGLPYDEDDEQHLCEEFKQAKFQERLAKVKLDSKNIHLFGTRTDGSEICIIHNEVRRAKKVVRLEDFSTG